jgi:hypothetical protein
MGALGAGSEITHRLDLRCYAVRSSGAPNVSGLHSGYSYGLVGLLPDGLISGFHGFGLAGALGLTPKS